MSDNEHKPMTFIYKVMMSRNIDEDYLGMSFKDFLGGDPIQSFARALDLGEPMVMKILTPRTDVKALPSGYVTAFGVGDYPPKYFRCTGFEEESQGLEEQQVIVTWTFEEVDREEPGVGGGQGDPSEFKAGIINSKFNSVHRMKVAARTAESQLKKRDIMSNPVKKIASTSIKAQAIAFADQLTALTKAQRRAEQQGVQANKVKAATALAVRPERPERDQVQAASTNSSKKTSVQAASIEDAAAMLDRIFKRKHMSKYKLEVHNDTIQITFKPGAEVHLTALTLKQLARFADEFGAVVLFPSPKAKQQIIVVSFDL